MRGVLRRAWALRAGKLYLAGALVLLLVLPLVLLIVMPENPEPGFWTDLGKDWIIRGPSTFVGVVIAACIVLPVALRRAKRRAKAEEPGGAS